MKRAFWVLTASFFALAVLWLGLSVPGGCDSPTDTVVLFDNSTATSASQSMNLYNTTDALVYVKFDNLTAPTVSIAGSADNGSNYITFKSFTTGSTIKGDGMYIVPVKALTHLKVTVTKQDKAGVGARKGNVSVTVHSR